ncbi:MAG: hypothetical protein AB7D37_01105 [Desulfovibrio sp.]
MTEGSPHWMSDDEREKLDKRINDLLNVRRKSKGKKNFALTAKELSAIDEIGLELASGRNMATTGAKTFKVHLNNGTPTSIEVVQEKSVKRQLN